jgi:hypothetical protein
LPRGCSGSPESIPVSEFTHLRAGCNLTRPHVPGGAPMLFRLDRPAQATLMRRSARLRPPSATEWSHRWRCVGSTPTPRPG